jgi:hypothetical protein
MAKSIHLGEGEVEFRALDRKVEMRFTVEFSPEDLVAFLDDIYCQAEDVISRMDLLTEDEKKGLE